MLLKKVSTLSDRQTFLILSKGRLIATIHYFFCKIAKLDSEKFLKDNENYTWINKNFVRRKSFVEKVIFKQKVYYLTSRKNTKKDEFFFCK